MSLEKTAGTSLIPFAADASRVSPFLIGRTAPTLSSAVPAQLTRGLTLVAVHTGFYSDIAGDTMEAVRKPVTELFKRYNFDFLYEHQAMHHYPSYLRAINKYGVGVDNETAPGSYIIPELHGNHFVLTGGGFNACHGRAFGSLLNQIFLALPERAIEPVRIDIPAFATYINYQDGAEGEVWMESCDVIGRNFSPYFNKLAKMLPKFGCTFEHYDASGYTRYSGLNTNNPAVRVRVFDSPRVMDLVMQSFLRENPLEIES